MTEVIRNAELEAAARIICAWTYVDGAFDREPVIREECFAKALQIRACLSGPKIPDGWILVPQEPTGAWVKAMRATHGVGMAEASKLVNKVLGCAPEYTSPAQNGCAS